MFKFDEKEWHKGEKPTNKIHDIVSDHPYIFISLIILAGVWYFTLGRSWLVGVIYEWVK